MILKAIKFAQKSHEGQFRKYTNRPYIEHPLRVMCKYALRDDSIEHGCLAALFHDLVEDTSVSIADIEQSFNYQVSYLVQELTNPSKQHPELNRAARKEMDRLHLSKCSYDAKIIKMIDRIDNLNEMKGAEQGFIKKYCEESRLLAEAIGDVDLELKNELLQSIDNLL